jgi:hypothetical protein
MAKLTVWQLSARRHLRRSSAASSGARAESCATDLRLISLYPRLRCMLYPFADHGGARVIEDPNGSRPAFGRFPSGSPPASDCRTKVR